MKENDKDDRKKITVFVQDELHTAASIKLAQKGGKPKGYSFQSVLEKLLEEWSGGQRAVEVQPEGALGSERYRADLENLLEVLEHGTAEDRSLVRGLIKNSAEAVRGRAAHSSGKALPPNPSRSSRSTQDRNRPAR